jgi:hypothetical protein
MVTRDAKPGDDVVFKHCKNGHSSDFLERRERREKGERGESEERERGERVRGEREERAIVANALGAGPALTVRADAALCTSRMPVLQRVLEREVK